MECGNGRHIRQAAGAGDCRKRNRKLTKWKQKTGNRSQKEEGPQKRREDDPAANLRVVPPVGDGPLHVALRVARVEGEGDTAAVGLAPHLSKEGARALF